MEKLYPKYKCPICKDWFHMPYKYCECDSDKISETIFNKLLSKIKLFLKI